MSDETGSRMKWISIIPMRAGSKGLPNKNVRSILGKPLYRYSVDTALSAGTECIYISTNIAQVLSAPKEAKIKVLKRPDELCTDEAKMSAVILNLLNSRQGIEIDDNRIIVLMQPTSPLRSKTDLLSALEQFSISDNVDLLMAVTETKNTSLKYGIVDNGRFRHISTPEFCFENRQNLPKLYRPNGAFYIFKAGWYRTNKTLATISTVAYEMPNNRSLDIDSLDDVERVEEILKSEKGK